MPFDRGPMSSGSRLFLHSRTPWRTRFAMRLGGRTGLIAAFLALSSGPWLTARGDEPALAETPAGGAFFLIADTPSSEASTPDAAGSELGTGSIRELLLKNLGSKRPTPTASKESPPKDSTSKTSGGKDADADEPQIAFETAKGSSSAAVRRLAASEVPLAELAAADQIRAKSILDETGYFRRLPTLTVPVVPEVYLHFLGHPDTAASVWRAMNISKLKLRAVSDTAYEGDTGDGTTGRMELVHRRLGGDGVEQLVVLCEGNYKTPLLTKPIQARSMLVMRTKFTRETDGQVYATHRGDVFVSFPSQTIEAVSKVMTPVTAVLSDRTFCEVTVFLKLMSAAMSRRPDWVEHVVEKMEGVPDERKRELLVLTAQTFVSRNREALAKGATRVKAVPVGGSAASDSDAAEPERATIRPAAAEQAASERAPGKAE